MTTIDQNNKPYLKFVTYSFFIFLSILILELPYNQLLSDQFSYSEFHNEFDSNNNSEENESNYELEIDDFIKNKHARFTFLWSKKPKNTHEIKPPELIYLETPYPPPELV